MNHFRVLFSITVSLLNYRQGGNYSMEEELDFFLGKIEINAKKLFLLKNVRKMILSEHSFIERINS